MEILAANYAQARAILMAEIQQGPEGEQKDVARVLYKSIVDYARSRAEAPKIDPGTPSTQGPAVQAELAREKFIALTQARKGIDASDAFNKMVDRLSGANNALRLLLCGYGSFRR